MQGSLTISRLEQPRLDARGKDNILVIRHGGIGDLIMLTNALRAFKEQNQDKKLYLLTLPKWIPFFRGLPYLAGVIDASQLEDYAPGIGFEEIIGLSMSAEPKVMPTGKIDWEEYITKDRVVLFEEYLGVSPEEKRFDIILRDAWVNEIRVSHEELSGNEPFILLSVGSNSYFRSIPQQLLMDLIDMITGAMGATAVLMGTSKPWCKWLLGIGGDRIVNLIDQTNEQGMAALVSLSNMVISSDAGPAHIAGVLNKPTLVLVGNIPFDLRYKYYPTVRGIEGAVKPNCAPCYDVKYPGNDGTPDCRHGDISGSPCLRNITINQVYEACIEMAKGWKPISQ